MNAVDDILLGLAERIPGTPALVATFESPCPDTGVGRAFARGPSAAPPGGLPDLSRLLGRPPAGDSDASIPERLPPMGIFADHPESNPVAWSPLGGPPAAPAFRIGRSRSDARWIRVPDDSCVGILDGDVRVDVDEAGREWLFCEPSTRAALRLHGGWVLVTLDGNAWLCREAPATVAVVAPDARAWAAHATLDPLLEEEAVDAVDRAGLLLRFGRPPAAVAARIRAGEPPPIVGAIRAWAAATPAAAWAVAAHAAVDRARGLLAVLPPAERADAVQRACVVRDELESTWVILVQAGAGDAVLAALDAVDEAAEERGLGEVEIEPVPVRLQYEARGFARWWGRP